MKLVDERVLALFKRHWRQTLTYWSVFFSFGLTIAFLGPTILDLRCQTRSSLQQITWVFFCQQLFMMLGSAVGGVFNKKLLSSLVALFTCTFLASIIFALIPLCYHWGQLAVAMAISGFSMGITNTISNVQLVELYQKDSTVFLQGLHFFIGLGALVSPLVANPFQSDENCVISANWTGGNFSTDLENGAGLPDPSDQYIPHAEGVAITTVAYAFWIMALINLPVPMGVLALMYHERLQLSCRSSPPLLDEGPGSSTDNPDNSSEDGHRSVFDCCGPADLRGQPATFFLLHALGGAIVFICDGIVDVYAAFVYTYAVSPPLLVSHTIAGYLDSVFWASITLGSLAFAYLSYVFPPSGQLTVSLVGVILAQCLLMVFYTSWVCLFIGTCVLGLCITNVFPSMVAYVEDILDYKGCATTVLTTSSSTGEMLLQLMVGSMMHVHGSYAFPLCCTIASVIGFLLFLLLLCVQHVHRRRQTDSSDSSDIREKASTSDS